MNTDHLKKAVTVGVAGCVAMTAFSFVAGYLNLPQTDFHGLITGLLHTGTVGAWVVYFGLGGTFAYLYGTFFHSKLPAHSWMKGTVYAFCLWLFVEVVVMPLTGGTFFHGSMTTAFGMLLGMGVYGATVGYMYDRS